MNKALKKEPPKEGIKYLNMLVECLTCDLKMQRQKLKDLIKIIL